MYSLVALSLVAFTVALFITPRFRNLALSWGPADTPGAVARIDGSTVPRVGSIPTALAFVSPPAASTLASQLRIPPAHANSVTLARESDGASVPAASAFMNTLARIPIGTRCRKSQSKRNSLLCEGRLIDRAPGCDTPTSKWMSSSSRFVTPTQPAVAE